jgi:hypothetical protein
MEDLPDVSDGKTRKNWKAVIMAHHNPSFLREILHISVRRQPGLYEDGFRIAIADSPWILKRFCWLDVMKLNSPFTPG